MRFFGHHPSIQCSKERGFSWLMMISSGQADPVPKGGYFCYGLESFNMVNVSKPFPADQRNDDTKEWNQDNPESEIMHFFER